MPKGKVKLGPHRLTVAGRKPATDCYSVTYRYGKQGLRTSKFFTPKAALDFIERLHTEGWGQGDELTYVGLHVSRIAWKKVEEPTVFLNGLMQGKQYLTNRTIAWLGG